MSYLNDLLAHSDTSTNASSAKLNSHTPAQKKSNMIGDFINTLAKYAQAGARGVGGVVNDLGNATAETAQGWAQVPHAISQQVQGKPITPLKDMSPSGQRGIDMIQGGVMSGGLENPEVDFSGIGAQAKGVANDARDFAGTVKSNAAIQPGGLQAGFVGAGKTAEDAAASAPQYAFSDHPPVVPTNPGGEFTHPNVPAPEPKGLPSLTTKLESSIPTPKGKPPMITANKADPHAIAQMGLNFDVPRRIAQNQMVKPDVVMNQLIDDGISGRNLDDLQHVANSITGERGAFPTINNHILSKIKTPIDYSDAIISKNTNLPSVLEGETPGFINQINKEVNHAMSPLDYLHKPSESGSPVGLSRLPEEGKGYASDLFQASQNLQRISRMYMRKASTDMGELSHPELERAAMAINEIKNSIDDAIDMNVSPEVYKSFKSDPFVQQQLQRVPPNVAKRWLAGAERFKDGQTIQAPYVNLSHMIEHTKDTQLSVWTKAAKAMQAQSTSGGISNAVKDIIPGPKILKTAAGGLTKIATKPFDKTAEDIFEENMAGKASGGFKIPGGKATKAIGALGLAGAAGAGAESIKNLSNAQGNDHTDEGYNGHTNNISQPSPIVNSQVETDMNKIDPSVPAADPRSMKGSDGNSLAMDAGTHQTALAKLDALTKTDPSYITNPIKAGQLAAAYKAINDKFNDSQSLMNSYNKVQTVQQKITNAQDLLSKTSPLPSDKFGLLESGHEMVDPKYQSLVNDLNFIENSDPRLKGQLSNLATKEGVKTALDNAAKLLLSEHNQLIKSYGGGVQSPQGTTPTQQQAPASQLPAGLPAPVNGGLPPTMDNGSYQFTAPNPMFQ